MRTFYNYGESDEDTPINAEFLNEIESKLRHIRADENSTIINSELYLDENKTKNVVIDVTETTPINEEL